MFGASGVYDREPQPALVGIRLSGVEVTPLAKDRQRPTGHARLGALFGPRGLSPPDRPTDGGLVTACRWAAWRATGSTRFSRRDRGKRLTAAIGVGSSDSPNPSTRHSPTQPCEAQARLAGIRPNAERRNPCVLAAAIGVGSSDSPNPSTRQSSAARVGATGFRTPLRVAVVASQILVYLRVGSVGYRSRSGQPVWAGPVSAPGTGRGRGGPRLEGSTARPRVASPGVVLPWRSWPWVRSLDSSRGRHSGVSRGRGPALLRSPGLGAAVRGLRTCSEPRVP